jgi:hypothetical protein
MNAVTCEQQIVNRLGFRCTVPFKGPEHFDGQDR